MLILPFESIEATGNSRAPGACAGRFVGRSVGRTQTCACATMGNSSGTGRTGGPDHNNVRVCTPSF